MQKGNMPAKEPRLDEFTAKAVTDPKNPGEVLLVTGFLGASSEPKHTRIYWDASLGTYVDVKTTDITHTEPLPKEQSPLGGSYIWLKRDAQVSFGAGGQSAKGKFFEGPLMAAYGGQFGALGGGGAGVPAAQALAVAGIPSLVCSYAAGCWFSWNACPSMVGPACGPHQSHVVCPPYFQVQEAAGAAAPAIAGSLAPAWCTGNACTVGFGCIPHQSHPPVCSHVVCQTQLQAQIAGTHGVQCWVSYGACHTAGCGSVGCGSVNYCVIR